MKDTVLIVTDENEPSANLVIEHLNKIGQNFFRLNVSSFFKLQSKLTLGLDSGFKGDMRFCDGSRINLESIKSIWFRRPKPIIVDGDFSSLENKFIDDEISSSLWSMYTCFDSVYWMNHPLYARYLLEHNKLFQLKLAEESGLFVPDTIVTNNPDDLIDFCERHDGFVAVKAVRSRIFQESPANTQGIYTNRITLGYLKEHKEDISISPLMAQEYVPKKLEFRVTIVGNHILSCAIHSQDSERTKEDWRRYDFANVKHEAYELPDNVKKSLLDFMSKCKMNFGAIDFILTPDGKYVFLEINPSGQYIWIENLTGLPISRTIAEVLSL